MSFSNDPIDMLDPQANRPEFNRVFITRDARISMHHTIGKRMPADTKMTATEAFQEAGMMWSIQKIADGARFGERFYPTGQYQLWRTPTEGEPEFLGYAGEDYQPVLNRQLAYWLDSVAEEYPVESAGYVKGKNAASVVVFSGMQWDIRVAPRKKDELQDRLMVINPIQVGRAIAFQWMSKAIWCTNQLNFLIGNAYNSNQLGNGIRVERSGNNGDVRNGVMKLAHNNNTHKAAEYVTGQLALAARAQPERQEFIQHMANVPLNARQRHEVINAAFPDPKNAQMANTIRNAADLAGGVIDATGRGLVEQAESNTEAARLRNARMREMVEISLEDRGIGASAYAVANAVVEVVEWRQGQRAEGEAIAYDMINGDRANVVNRAMTVIGKYIK